MGKWADRLRERQNLQIPTPKQLTKPTKAPSVSFVSAPPKDIQNNGIIKVHSDKLNQEIWVLPDGDENDFSVFDSKVYLDSEVRELVKLDTSSMGLKSIHLVREVFEGVIIDA